MIPIIITAKKITIDQKLSVKKFVSLSQILDQFILILLCCHNNAKNSCFCQAYTNTITKFFSDKRAIAQNTMVTIKHKIIGKIHLKEVEQYLIYPEQSTEEINTKVNSVKYIKFSTIKNIITIIVLKKPKSSITETMVIV